MALHTISSERLCVDRAPGPFYGVKQRSEVPGGFGGTDLGDENVIIGFRVW